MKILVLGNPNSLWEKEFIQYVLLPIGAEVVLQGNYNNYESFSDFYYKSNVIVAPLRPISSWIMKIPNIRALIMSWQQKKALMPYIPFDVIINMFASPIALKRAVSFRRLGARIYAYFCGSDIARASWMTCRRLESSLKKTSGVVFASDNVYDAYIRKIGSIVGVHLTTVRFGLSVFDLIDSMLMESSKNDCKAQIGLTPDKVTVCIGYNANEAQNHLRVFEQIHTLPRPLLDRLVLLLPMTYGGPNTYIDQVEKAVSELDCDYILFRSFMSQQEMTQLWLATDTFINAQSTDGLSGSVLEAMYAGATLLNASWLRYREYDEWGLDYISFLHYIEIPKLLTALMDSSYKKKADNNRILKNKMSWQQCREAWSNLIYK